MLALYESYLTTNRLGIRDTRPTHRKRYYREYQQERPTPGIDFKMEAARASRTPAPASITTAAPFRA